MAYSKLTKEGYQDFKNKLTKAERALLKRDLYGRTKLQDRLTIATNESYRLRDLLDKSIQRERYIAQSLGKINLRNYGQGNTIETTGKKYGGAPTIERDSKKRYHAILEKRKLNSYANMLESLPYVTNYTITPDSKNYNILCNVSVDIVGPMLDPGTLDRAPNKFILGFLASKGIIPWVCSIVTFQIRKEPDSEGNYIILKGQNTDATINLGIENHVLPNPHFVNYTCYGTWKTCIIAPRFGGIEASMWNIMQMGLDINMEESVQWNYLASTDLSKIHKWQTPDGYYEGNIYLYLCNHQLIDNGLKSDNTICGKCTKLGMNYESIWVKQNQTYNPHQYRPMTNELAKCKLCQIKHYAKELNETPQTNKVHLTNDFANTNEHTIIDRTTE